MSQNSLFKWIFILVIFKLGRWRNSPPGWGAALHSAALAVAQQLLPGEGTSGCTSNLAKTGQGEGMKCLTFLWLCLVTDSGSRSVSLSWWLHYLFLRGQGFRSHPRILAASQRQLPCHGRWMEACTGEASSFSLVLTGKRGSEEQEWHHVTQLSLTHKLQRIPVWNLYNYHPVAGTSKRRGKIGLSAPCPTISLTSTQLSLCSNHKNVETRTAQNSGKLSLPEWRSRGPQVQRTPNLELRVTLLQNNLSLSFFFK